MKNVTVVIPCYNEEKGISGVIKGFSRPQLKKYGYQLNILVIDNNSKDRTAEVARAAGARVIHEPKKGKGNAIRAGFYAITKDTDYVVMLDGDDTYRPEEVIRLLEPIDSGFCNVVIGSRLGGRIADGSMTNFNRMGNWIFSHLVRYFYKVNVTDVLTGYFAWNRAAIEHLRPHLKSSGFAIEMEMITRMARLGEDIYSVPISYHSRAGESNLHPVRDGYRIMKMFLHNLTWKPALAIPTPTAKDLAQGFSEAIGAATGEPKRVAKNASPQRIVFVSDAIYPYNKGGKEKRLYELSTRLATRGNDVHIYTMKWWKGRGKTKVENGVTLHAISKLYPMYKGDRRSISEGVLFGLACLKLLFVKFDVLDVDHMPFFPVISAWLVCKLRGKKLYGTWHEALSRADWTSYMGRTGLIASLIERLTIHLPNTITAASPQTKRLLADYHHRQKGVRLVASGIDTQALQSIEPAAIDLDILYVGRLVKDKNVDLLIKAVAILKQSNPDVRCVIIGHGIEKPNLKRLITKLGLKQNVTLMRPIPDASDLYSYMKQAKVFVLPSSREGFGIVALEALGLGTPVVTVNAPANAAKELVTEGKTGSVVEATPEAIAQAAKAWMRRRARAGELVTRYDWDTLAAALSEVYAS